jgi:NADH-quinone oxidoreductase subunit B
MTYRPTPPAVASELDLGDSFVATTVDRMVNWARSNSLWPFPFATACCGIEFMAAVGSRFDVARFGAEFVRFSPRQADLLVVAGTITYKQAPVLRRIYEQMLEPRWVIAFGACACSGGFYDCYCTLPGIDEIIPVDIYLAGCPPRPEAFLDAVVKLQGMISRESLKEQGTIGV